MKKMNINEIFVSNNVKPHLNKLYCKKLKSLEQNVIQWFRNYMYTLFAKNITVAITAIKGLSFEKMNEHQTKTIRSFTCYCFI